MVYLCACPFCGLREPGLLFPYRFRLLLIQTPKFALLALPGPVMFSLIRSAPGQNPVAGPDASDLALDAWQRSRQPAGSIALVDRTLLVSARNRVHHSSWLPQPCRCHHGP